MKLYTSYHHYECMPDYQIRLYSNYPWSFCGCPLLGNQVFCFQLVPWRCFVSECAWTALCHANGCKGTTSLKSCSSHQPMSENKSPLLGGFSGSECCESSIQSQFTPWNRINFMISSTISFLVVSINCTKAILLEQACMPCLIKWSSNFMQENAATRFTCPQMHSKSTAGKRYEGNKCAKTSGPRRPWKGQLGCK